MQVAIRPGSLQEAVALQLKIPEFENPYSLNTYKQRLSGTEHLVLIAYIGDRSVGFKVGYDRFLDGSVFYSWMGGVLPEYRQKGVARKLLQKMEVWCKLKGYKYLKFKTLNRHKSMIHFALNEGFDVVDFEKKRSLDESRIYFMKKL